MVMRLRLTARRQAERLVREFLDHAPASDGSYVAQAYYILGLIAKSRGQYAKADAYLRDSHDLYVREEMNILAAEVRAAFCATPAP